MKRSVCAKAAATDRAIQSSMPPHRTRPRRRQPRQRVTAPRLHRASKYPRGSRPRPDRGRQPPRSAGTRPRDRGVTPPDPCANRASGPKGALRWHASSSPPRCPTSTGSSTSATSWAPCSRPTSTPATTAPRGHEVLFICATDEHGTPAELAAAKAGQPVARVLRRTARDPEAALRRLPPVLRPVRPLLLAPEPRAHPALRQTPRRGRPDPRGAPSARSTPRPTTASCPTATSRAPARTAATTAPAATSARTAPRCSTRPTSSTRARPSPAPPTSNSARRKHLYLRQSALQDDLAPGSTARHDWPILTTSIAHKWLNDGEGLHDRGITRDLDWGVPAQFDGAPLAGDGRQGLLRLVRRAHRIHRLREGMGGRAADIRIVHGNAGGGPTRAPTMSAMCSSWARTTCPSTRSPSPPRSSGRASRGSSSTTSSRSTS